MIPKHIAGYHKAEWGLLIVLVTVFAGPLVVTGFAIVLLPPDQSSIVISTVAIIIAALALWLANDD